MPKKSLFSVLASSLLVLSLTAQGMAASFSDIRSGSELSTMVDTLSEAGIINGYPDGSFQPERTINRAEALKIIFETVQTEADSDTNSGFSDVDRNQWFAQYVTTAKNRNIVKGYADGTFKPGQQVNRAEFIKMALTALPFFDTLPSGTGEANSQFSDIDPAQWYVTYVNKALAMDFLRRSDRLRPTEFMERQDAVEIVYAIHQYLQENPQALNSNSTVPYIPEESFLVVDPTKPQTTDFFDYEFGPDKLNTNFDGETTVVQNIYHGYNLTLPGFVKATGGSETADRNMFLTFPDECQISVIVYEGRTANEHYESVTDPSGLMSPYNSRSLTKLDQYDQVNAYEISMAFGEPFGDAKDYFIERNGTIYSVGPRGHGCDEKTPIVLENFEFR